MNQKEIKRILLLEGEELEPSAEEIKLKNTEHNLKAALRSQK